MKMRVIVWISWYVKDTLLHCVESGMVLGNFAPGARRASGVSFIFRLFSVGGVFRISTFPVLALLVRFLLRVSGLGRLSVSSMSATCSGVNVYFFGIDSFSNHAMVSFSDNTGRFSLSDRMLSISL